jgi:hypothetical protein
VTLSSFRFGLGVSLVGGGAAEGDFAATLLGSYAGQPMTMTAACKAARGSATAPSTITFSGTCNFDPGNGTAPVSTPFSMTANGSKGTLSLKIGSTTFPILTGTGTNGRITVY